MVRDGVEWFGDMTTNTIVDVYDPIGYCNDPWGEQSCYRYGGYWDYNTCSCQYYYYY